jgi:hypothetical protein
VVKTVEAQQLRKVPSGCGLNHSDNEYPQDAEPSAIVAAPAILEHRAPYVEKAKRTMAETYASGNPISRQASASLIGRSGSSAFRLSTPQCRCRSRARASLRNRHQGPSIMGFEDEGINLMGGLAVNGWQVQADTRSHLIHRPARDIIPPLGGARVSSYLI